MYEIERTDDRGDISPSLEAPIYRPYIFFQQTSVVVQDTSKKQLAQEKVAYVTNQIICAWKENKFVDYITLEVPDEKSIPLHILNIFFRRLMNE